MLGALILATGVAGGLVCLPLRDARGRIARSRPAVTLFRRAHPCPASGATRGACPGYVVDHVVPLKRCGADDPINMQWQTVGEARAKDLRE